MMDQVDYVHHLDQNLIAREGTAVIPAVASESCMHLESLLHRNFRLDEELERSKIKDQLS